jgi:hypothetical protein
MINADRWKRAHNYHRQRQNTHYQSINQPGIVCGFGVRSIPAPAQVKARDRDQRWVQVQPGIAIDLYGNVIVLPQPFSYHIDTEVKNEPATIYLTAAYRDPDELQREQQVETVQETYRLEEVTRPPAASEVELCRILLQPGALEITAADDVFFPGYNQIDLRYRVTAQTRPQALVRVAQVNRSDPGSDRNFFNILSLLQSVDALYPALKGADDLGQVTLGEGSDSLNDYDLLYLTGTEKLELAAPEYTALSEYLHQGGVLLVDAPSNANELIQSVQEFAGQLGTPLQPLSSRRNHPVRTRPFLFAALPMSHQQPIQISLCGGIILVVGDLASSWGIDEALSLSRVVIRTAQELGVNLLHYAWKRHQLTGLQQEDASGHW